METTLLTASLGEEQLQHVEPRSQFGLIVVGVDDGSAALEAVRQAAALADANTTIELVAVGIEDATDALARAEAELGHSPARVITRSVEGGPAWKTLLAEAKSADLLVVGRQTTSRLGGYASGSAATHVIHHARVPVLVVTRPAERRFPERVLVAIDPYARHPEWPVATAAGIARRDGGELVMLRVDWARAAMPPQVARVVADYERATGREIEDLILGGNPHREIVRTAEREGASLVVVGSRELRGAAVRSVSERVAHEAPCSVLIVHDHVH
jgi:nucleotide-binding universal stress UspA family protein